MTHVAFIRAINVAGHAVVPMARVTRMFAAAGCADVRSYIQSGNILVRVDRSSRKDVFAAAAARLARLTGEPAHIAWRSAGELQAAVGGAPFGSLVDDRTVKLYVACLMQKPRRRPPLPLSLEKERLELVGLSAREAYIVSRRKPNGFYGFPGLFVEKELGVPATCRNWSTVTKVLNLMRA